jgi:hypothetical protein
MARATLTTTSGEQQTLRRSRHEPPRNSPLYSRKQRDVGREQLLRALLDEAHNRIRMLEKAVEQLTADLLAASEMLKPADRLMAAPIDDQTTDNTARANSFGASCGRL